MCQNVEHDDDKMHINRCVLTTPVVNFTWASSETNSQKKASTPSNPVLSQCDLAFCPISLF